MLTLDQNEHVIMEVRKHWFILFPQILANIAVVLLPIVFYLAYLDTDTSMNAGIKDDLLFWFFYCTLLLAFLIHDFITWTNYYLDIWIVTNKKIYYIEQNNIFDREISTLHLDKIQDITVEINGLIATFLHFGNIKVQTAGSEKEFVINHVDRPNDIREKINDAIQHHAQNVVEVKDSV